MASPDGRENSVKIHQDANISVAVLNEGDSINHEINPNRSVWLQIAKGSVEIQGHNLLAGDGAAITQEKNLNLTATSDETEILLFDLA